MSAFLYREPVRAISAGGVYPGADLLVTQGEELVALYADPLLQARLPNPVRADAAGRFPPIYAAQRGIVCTLTSGGVEVFSVAAASSMPITVDTESPRDDAGELMPLATRTFLDAMTTELAEVYADEALETPLTNPVVADESGAFPAVYSPFEYFRVQLHKSPGNPALVPAALGYQAAKRYVGGPLVYDVEVRPPPPAPTLFGVIVDAGNKLSWAYPLSASAFRLYRAVGDGNFEFLTQVSGNTFTYTDDAIAPATVHHYRLTAVVLMESAESNEVMLAPLEYGTPGVLRTVYTAVTSGGDDQAWSRPEEVNFGSLLMVGPGGYGANINLASQRAAGGGGGGGQVSFVRKYSYPSTGTVVVSASTTTFDGSVARRGGASSGLSLDGGPDSGGVGQSVTSDLSWNQVNVGAQTEADGFYSSGGRAESFVYDTDSQLFNRAAGGGGGGGAGGNGGDAIASLLDAYTRSGDGGAGAYHGRVVGDDLGDDGWFAGGGSGSLSQGAGAYGEAVLGEPGKGGGGRGRNDFGSVSATDGMAGTGGGGGGGTVGADTRGAGGTGIVVMVYYDPDVYGVDYWPYEA